MSHPLARLSLVLCFVALAKDAPAQTRPQRFFDWTTPTFAAAEFAARRAAVRKVITTSGDDGVLLVPSAEGRSHGETFRQLDDFLYFTGLELPRSILAIDAKEGSSTLFAPATDKRFFNPSRRNDFPGRKLSGDPQLKQRSGIRGIRSITELDAALDAWAKAGRAILVRGARSGALPSLAPSLFQTPTPVDTLRRYLAARQPKLTVRNAFSAIAAVRMVKSAAELAVIRRACAITCDGIRSAAARVRSGVDERTLEGVLEWGFKAGGAQRVAFSSIIKSGPNSLWPWRILAAHYDRRNRKMVDGDLVIFDVGCELHQYATDVGRTFPVSGTFTKRQAEALAMATRVADAILAAVKPGTSLPELQRVANAAIPKSQRRYMQTGLFFGHHVGLATGDPSLAGAKLRPGMVFTVEPWYYNHDEEIAVFVEDMVLVTKDGAENLTRSLPRDAEALAKMVDRR